MCRLPCIGSNCQESVTVFWPCLDATTSLRLYCNVLAAPQSHTVHARRPAWRNGIRGSLKNCSPLRGWGFESPHRHHPRIQKELPRISPRTYCVRSCHRSARTATHMSHNCSSLGLDVRCSYWGYGAVDLCWFYPIATIGAYPGKRSRRDGAVGPITPASQTYELGPHPVYSPLSADAG